MKTASTKLRPLVALAVLLAACGCGPPPERPHVLLVSLDTTRADHLGAYGYPRATSPHLDALARESTRYERALSTSSWTLPAHASLFTGKLPSSHGARYDPEGPLVLAEAIRAPHGIRARGLAPGEPTLAGELARAGYDTGAVVAGPWLLRTFGLGQGFAHYDDAGIVDHAGRAAADVTDAALRWLARERDEPFFLFVNYFDPHFPYDPPPPHDRAFLPPGVAPDPNARGQFEALYDGEIRYMDAQLARLLDFLRERDLYRRTVVVVTSDHGELFGEHGAWGHGKVLYEPLVRVPLLWKPAGPPQPGRVETRPVQLVDLHDWIRAAAAGEAERAPAPRREGPLLAEVQPIAATDARGAARGAWRALWVGDLKLHWSSLGRHRLFDLAWDPGERVDLASREPGLVADLVERLDAVLAALPPPPDGAGELAIDPATREALDRLGYLE